MLRQETVLGEHPALQTIRNFGGREVAAAVGGLIAAKSKNIAVVIDGWAALAAYAVVEALDAGAASHVNLAACSGLAQRGMAARLCLRPIVGADVAAGPGCGAAISVSILKAACDLSGLAAK